MTAAQRTLLALVVGLVAGIGVTLLFFDRGSLSDPLSAAVVQQLGQDEAACLLREADLTQDTCVGRIEAAISTVKAAGNQLGVPNASAYGQH